MHGAELSCSRMHDKEGDCGFKLLHDHHCRIWLCCIALSYVLATYATYVTKPYILVHTGGSAPLPAVKTQMCYRTVLPIRNMHALAQENTEVCCAYSVVEESVYALGKRGFRQAAVHHPGTHSAFKARNTLGREREWIIGHKRAKASYLEKCPHWIFNQENTEPSKYHYTIQYTVQVCCIPILHRGYNLHRKIMSQKYQHA